MGQSKIIVGMVLTAIFSIALISWAISFGVDNNTSINIGSDTEGLSAYSDLNSTMRSYIVNSNGTLEAFQDSEITDSSESTRTGGTFKDAPKSPSTALKNILTQVNTNIFGNDSAFTLISGMIITTFLTLVFFYVWKLWKGGNPD